jgi:flavin-dependent dehydrogenase
MDTQLCVDIYEPRDFMISGPPGCNMCGGVISETLVQNLTSEGVFLPTDIVQRGIDSYKLHTNAGSVRIATPGDERRIAAVFRGNGPRDRKEKTLFSFDGYIFQAAKDKGANTIRARVDDVAWVDGRPQLSVRGGSGSNPGEPYDLLVVSAGINTALLKSLEKASPGFKPPRATKTYICEYYFGADQVEKYLGSTFHVFLLNIPRLEFAAIIPKGDYATVCLLGDEIDNDLIQAFLNAPEVKEMMPTEWQGEKMSCQCSPRMNIGSATQPYADRLLVIGDSGVTRLYKDGMGAAYRIAKAAASTAVIQGVSAEDFRRFFWPACKRIVNDNLMGKIVFLVSRQIQNKRFAQRALVKMVGDEQRQTTGRKTMSTVMWDMFTGSAPYTDIFMRTLDPRFLLRFFRDLALSLVEPVRRGG